MRPLLAVLAALATTAPATAQERVVALGGSVAEIVGIGRSDWL